VVDWPSAAAANPQNGVSTDKAMIAYRVNLILMVLWSGSISNDLILVRLDSLNVISFHDLNLRKS
jgi:hypothetical protein